MKNKYFQSIRGIMILFVILIHCLYMNVNENVNFINIAIRTLINCAVPVFIYLSGFFVKKDDIENDTKKYIGKRMKRLMIPLIVYSLCYTVIYWLRTNSDLITVLKKFVFMESAAHLYYIVVLIQLVLLTPILLKGLKNKVIKIVLYAVTPIYLIINSIVNIFFEVTIPYYQYWIFGWLIYYLIGLEHVKIKFKNIIGIIIIIFLLACNMRMYYLNKNIYPFITSQLNFLNMFYAVLIISKIINVEKKYKSNKFTVLLEKIGDNSFGIYFIHMFVLQCVGIITKLFEINFIVEYLIKFFATTILSYLAIIIVKKITKNKFNKYIAF